MRGFLTHLDKWNEDQATHCLRLDTTGYYSFDHGGFYHEPFHTPPLSAYNQLVTPEEYC